MEAGRDLIPSYNKKKYHLNRQDMSRSDERGE